MSTGDIKVNPPIPFPREPVGKNIPPELAQFHRDLRNYLARIVDFLRGPLQAGRGGGGGTIAAFGTATLDGPGFVIVSEPTVVLSQSIMLVAAANTSSPPSYYVNGITDGQFTIFSSDPTDTGDVWWVVLNP